MLRVHKKCYLYHPREILGRFLLRRIHTNVLKLTTFHSPPRCDHFVSRHLALNFEGTEQMWLDKLKPYEFLFYPHPCPASTFQFDTTKRIFQGVKWNTKKLTKAESDAKMTALSYIVQNAVMKYHQDSMAYEYKLEGQFSFQAPVERFLMFVVLDKAGMHCEIHQDILKKLYEKQTFDEIFSHDAGTHPSKGVWISTKSTLSCPVHLTFSRLEAPAEIYLITNKGAFVEYKTKQVVRRLLGMAMDMPENPKSQLFTDSLTIGEHGLTVFSLLPFRGMGLVSLPVTIIKAVLEMAEHIQEKNFFVDSQLLNPEGTTRTLHLETRQTDKVIFSGKLVKGNSTLWIEYQNLQERIEQKKREQETDITELR